VFRLQKLWLSQLRCVRRRGGVVKSLRGSRSRKKRWHACNECDGQLVSVLLVLRRLCSGSPQHGQNRWSQTGVVGAKPWMTSLRLLLPRNDGTPPTSPLTSLNPKWGLA
jgi:hypothetical protein